MGFKTIYRTYDLLPGESEVSRSGEEGQEDKKDLRL